MMILKPMTPPTAETIMVVNELSTSFTKKREIEYKLAEYAE